MPDPNTIAKITPPDLSRAISRPRLMAQVQTAASRIILITGQAAQGKSTLAAQIAGEHGPPSVWMHLTEAEQDPATFYHLFLAALKVTVPDVDIGAHLKHPTIARGPQSVSARVAESIAAILAAIDARGPLMMVMDGIDALSEPSDTLAVIAHMIEALSPVGRLVLVSRETPPMRLEALRVRQDLLSLTNDDLAFNMDEIALFYDRIYNLALVPSQLQRIFRISGGWAGGLILVWEALRHLSEDQLAKVIDHGLPEALKGERLAYFSEAVFSRLDDDEQQFLVKSSIFDTITPRLIDRFLDAGSPGMAQATLSDMARRNLFIQPFYDEAAGWGYRFNQLFRDFLRDKFHRRMPAQTRRHLLAKAADLSWAAGDVEGAIRFFLRAEAFDKAAAGIKKIAMGLSAMGRFSDLAAWIARLPRSIIEDDTWLRFYQALGERIHGGRKTIRAFEKAFDRFEREKDQRGQLMAMGSLIETAVFSGHPTRELEGWLKSARELLERESGNPYYAFAKSMLWMQVAFGYLSVAGSLHQGLSACRNALLLAGSLKNATLTVNATIIHIFGLTLSGEFTTAEKALADIAHLVGAAYPEYRCLRDIVSMELALSRGDVRQASVLCDASREEINRFGLLFLYPIHLDLSGRLQIHEKSFDHAAQTAHHLIDVATLSANPFYGGLAYRLHALRAYHQGHFDRACRWAEQAIEAMSKSVGDSIHLFRCHLILGISACHTGDVDTARRSLEAADRFFSRVGSHLSLVETRLARSLCASLTGDRSAARRLRQRALDLAANKGYAAFAILSAEDAASVGGPPAGGPQSTGKTGNRTPVRRLDPAPTMPDAATPTGDSPPAMTIRTDDDDRLDIRTLGGFVVYRANGEAIADAQWAGQRQRLLLKAIIVNGCREVPREVLTDALWPDSSQEAALKRFKITLHRLRKILDPARYATSGGSFIQLKDNRVSLDMTRCRVDVNDFLAACDRIRHSRHGDNPQRLMDAYRQAAQVYRGNFLPEEPYLSWAEMKRCALRDQYVRVCLEMAAGLEHAGDLEAADERYLAAMAADPLAEQACRRSMRLCLRQGRRNEAIKRYQALTRALAAELDTVPDLATTALYESVIHSD